MSDFDITVSGSRVILDNLDALETTLLGKIQAAMHEAAVLGEQVMKANARVDTGEMRDATYAEVDDALTTTTPQIRLGDDSDHAIYNELGTVHMAAQPFIVPGAVAAGDYLKQNLQGLI